MTVTTGPDGDYLVTELLAGEYIVSIDLSSVDPGLGLTTPGSVTVTLDIGETFLDADFGLVQARRHLLSRLRTRAACDRHRPRPARLARPRDAADRGGVLVADRRRRGSVDG